MWLPVCLYEHEAPDENGSTLKGKDFFNFRVDPFSDGMQNQLDRIASPETVSLSLNPDPVEPGHALPLQTV